MMKINITELGTALDSALSFSFSSTAAELDAELDNGAEFTGAIEVAGQVVYTGSAFRVSGAVTATKSFTCDRCLKECEESERYEFSEDFVREDNGEAENVFAGDVIDITELVRDTLLASQSIGNVCKPDCKGLCPVCGGDLNEGECGCDRFVPDPRMAALQQLLNKE